MVEAMRLRLLAALLLAFTPFLLAQKSAAPAITVTVPTASFPQGMSTLTGHLIVVFSKRSKGEDEPRHQVQEQYDSAQAFGVDVEGLRPGGTVIINNTTAGYPLRHLADVPSGEYFVQAVFNVYEPFHLASGKTVWLSPDRGEGQHWDRKPGNPYNAPQKVDWRGNTSAKLTLDKVIPSVPTPDDLLAKDPGAKQYLRFIRILGQAVRVLGPRYVSKRLGAAAARL